LSENRQLQKSLCCILRQKIILHENYFSVGSRPARDNLGMYAKKNQKFLFRLLMPWVELIRYPISRKVNQNREVKNFPMSGRMPHGFFRPGNTSIHSRPTRVNMHHIMGMVRLWLLSRAQSNYRSKRPDDRKWEAVPEPQSGSESEVDE
jgi:hypothetical protein